MRIEGLYDFIKHLLNDGINKLENGGSVKDASNTLKMSINYLEKQLDARYDTNDDSIILKRQLGSTDVIIGPSPIDFFPFALQSQLPKDCDTIWDFFHIADGDTIQIKKVSCAFKPMHIVRNKINIRNGLSMDVLSKGLLVSELEQIHNLVLDNSNYVNNDSEIESRLEKLIAVVKQNMKG